MSAHVLTFGETMGLVRTAEIGDLADVTDARIGTGGADSNVAIGLARLGVEALWAGRVGADGLGRRVVRDIRGEKVDVRAVIDSGAPTGLMIKEKRTRETTRVTFYRSGSAGSRLAPGDLDLELVETAALVHISGITPSLSESAREFTHQVVDVARGAGVPISFDVNHRPSLWRSGDPTLLYRDLAAKADIVFAGDDEAALVTGESRDDPQLLARALVQNGAGIAVVKRGVLGSLALSEGIMIEREAIPITLVDSVGAGDAFVAGFLAGYVRQESLAECLRIATIAGGFACMGPGDWESMPRFEDLSLLDGHDPVTR